MLSLFVATLFVVIFIQIGLNIIFSEFLYVKSINSKMLSAYYDIVLNYNGNPSNIYNKVSKYEDELNIRVLIFNDFNDIIYTTMSNSELVPFLFKPFVIDSNGNKVEFFLDEPQLNTTQSFRSNIKTIAVNGTVNTFSGKHYIVLETPLLAIKGTISMINLFIFTTSTFAMIIGSIIIYFFSSKLSKPITNISKVSNNVANLNFSLTALEENNCIEIDTLAKSINFMSNKLETMIYDLKIANIELKRDNTEKKHVDEMRKEFIASVSHELKTPLSIMQGYGEILKLNTPDIDKDFYYDVIIDESKHMSDLVTRLLNISSLENGLTKLSYSDFNLTELASTIASKNEIISCDKQIKVITSQDFLVFADKLYISQCITNLISNAITYAFSTITIEITEFDNYFRLSVTNDGNHIPPENIEKLWFSFYREDKSRTRSKDKNFGLGLYIVKTIISAHNGNVGVYNTDDGVCFWFEINKF